MSCMLPNVIVNPLLDFSFGSDYNDGNHQYKDRKGRKWQ